VINLSLEAELFFQFGIIMLLSFCGAEIASRLGQSVILGYIAVGAFIGPFMNITVFGYTYRGLIQNTDMISYFAKMGLILLLFFVGLEFSISKLRKTRTAATILAIFNFAIDMFIGLTMATFMHWPPVDAFFLAAIIATGSSAVAAKTLMEIGRLSAPETDFIIGMSVVEDFIAMLLLTVAGSLIVRTDGGSVSIWTLVGSISLFYLIFLILGFAVMPRIMKRLSLIKNDEMFILFALGIVFTSAAMADMLYVQSLIGAFLTGMIFAETRMTERLKTRLMSMRDAFVAIFFVYFGMLINPSVLISIIPMIAMSVPLMFLGDVILTSSVAFLIGFPSKHAIFVGSTSAFRGAESMLFASVGGSSMGTVYAERMYAIAGPFALLMDIVAIPTLKYSKSFVARLSSIVPGYVKFSSLLISRTFSKIVMPQSLKIYGDAKRSTLPLWSFIMLAGVSIFLSTSLRLILLSAAGIAAYLSLTVLRKDLYASINLINYSNIGVGYGGTEHILHLIMKLVSALMVTVIAVIAIAGVYLPLSLLPVLLYVIYLLHSMHSTYYILHRGGERTRTYIPGSLSYGPERVEGTHLPEKFGLRKHPDMPSSGIRTAHLQPVRSTRHGSSEAPARSYFKER